MEAIIFVGLQAAGKTTFYARRLIQTHARISLDLLRTRQREAAFLRLCLETGQPFVVDNTNPTAAERERYILPARAAGFRVVAYVFELAVEEALRRNAGREGQARVPPVAIYSTRKRLQVPSFEEGFDALYRVRSEADGDFVVEEWQGAG